MTSNTTIYAYLLLFMYMVFINILLPPNFRILSFSELLQGKKSAGPTGLLLTVQYEVFRFIRKTCITQQ